MEIPAKKNRGGSLTREQFLLPEMRIVASLRQQGVDDEAIVARVKNENLFQYPTERMLANRAIVCIKRLDALFPGEVQCALRGVDPQTAFDAVHAIVELIAVGAPSQAAQANLYAMMCRYDLIDELMRVEIGERLACFDYTFTPMDLDAFITRFQVEYADAAKWADSTVYRIKSTLMSCLYQVGIAAAHSDDLHPVFMEPDLQDAIEALGDVDAVRAFTGQVM
ncbi:DUF1819 family protein [Collinsella sp. KGMB02528]|uniref:DUF1819 family protein n=1 Tax=Collinsella acetigenes TaxID=2713419 RepID=A0A7X9UB53_9ACTN|nr:DUF1819 family protein [Collinsella acetigenes]